MPLNAATLTAPAPAAPTGATVAGLGVEVERVLLVPNLASGSAAGGLASGGGVPASAASAASLPRSPAVAVLRVWRNDSLSPTDLATDQSVGGAVMAGSTARCCAVPCCLPTLIYLGAGRACSRH